MSVMSYSLGAAQEVTGSKHILEVDGRSFMIDCGAFQGKRAEARLRVVFAEEEQPVAYVPKAVYMPKPEVPLPEEIPQQEDLLLSLHFSMDS